MAWTPPELTAPRNGGRLFSRFGMLFQGAALFDSLTVWENVAFRLLNADGVKRGKAARAQAVEALAKVRLGKPMWRGNIPAICRAACKSASGLARAIVGAPEILIFDEPTTGLDPITADAVNDLIVEQVRGLGCTAISITHDLASARKIGDDVAMLHGGKIMWRGPVSGPGPLRQRLMSSSSSPGRSDGPITAAI